MKLVIIILETDYFETCASVKFDSGYSSIRYLWMVPLFFLGLNWNHLITTSKIEFCVCPIPVSLYFVGCISMIVRLVELAVIS